MAHLVLRLFGGFDLRSRAGDAVTLPNLKERALLAYLATEPDRARTRSHLADLLWGDQPEEKARHSLSQALSSLCKRLGAEVIRRGKHDVSLDPAAVDADVVRFLRLADMQDSDALRQSVELFSPDILADLDQCSSVFEDWAMTLRSRCEAVALSAGKAYLASHSGLAEPEIGISVAQSLLRIDPTDEHAHQALIRLYRANGRAAQARAQLEACRAILAEELGIEPAPETERLALSVAANPAQARDAAADAGHVPARPPSIAVLPFNIARDDLHLAMIAEGLIDDITTALTRYRALFVISHDSASAFDTGTGSAPAFCRRLGVRFGLCGHMRRVEGGLRINLRLVEAESEQSLWSERFTLDLQELVAFPDDFTDLLVGRIAGWLEEDALIRSQRRPLTSWSAYDHLLQGRALHERSWYSTRNIHRAIKHFERAIEIDPKSARAHAYMACAKSTPWFSARDNSVLDPCIPLAHRALELDPTEPEAHRMLGAIHLVRGEHDLSDLHFSRARELHPGHADILAHSARLAMHSGELETARQSLNRARQLNPLHPAWYWEHMAVQEFQSRNYAEALRHLSRIGSNSFYDRLYAASAAALMGDDKKGRHFLDIAERLRPGLSLQLVERFLPYRTDHDRDHVLEGLVRAGLKA